MKKVIIFIVFVTSVALHNQAFAQSVTVSGQLGYGSPQGDAFELNGESISKFGISIDADALYHPENIQKFGFGITYNTSFLFGSSNDALDIGIYGLNLYGVKAQYKFFDNVVSPYFSLSTGLAQLVTPEITDDNNNVILESEKSSAFGIRPELGLSLGGFLLSASYVVPMKYGIVDSKAGVFQLSLGYRYKAY